MTHLEGWGVVQRFELPGDGFRDLAASVSGVYAPESGDSVEDLATVGRPVVHAARLGEQTRLRLELAVGREGHPIGFELTAGERDCGRHDCGSFADGDGKTGGDMINKVNNRSHPKPVVGQSCLRS